MWTVQNCSLFGVCFTSLFSLSIFLEKYLFLAHSLSSKVRERERERRFVLFTYISPDSFIIACSRCIVINFCFCCVVFERLAFSPSQALEVKLLSFSAFRVKNSRMKRQRIVLHTQDTTQHNNRKNTQQKTATKIKQHWQTEQSGCVTRPLLLSVWWFKT